MISFFKAFAWVMFPFPCILLVLLLLPLPMPITGAIVKLADSILFLHPHPSVKLSLFWCLFGICVLTFAACVQAMMERKEVYESVKYSGGHTGPALINLLASERNAWVSGCATALWVMLHRYRSLMKRCNRLESRLEVVEKKKE